MVQVAARESLDVLRLADRPGGGLVFTGAGAIEAVHAARRQGFGRPMLTDRRRYAGVSRVRGTARLARSWLTGQRDANVTAVLTDSGYIGDGDTEALRAVLRQAADAGPDVTAVLPLHPHWLRKDSETLAAEVIAHDVPVALVLERHGDPLATHGAVAGVIDLLRTVPSAALLGAGLGALAALAFGAQWAAVGVAPQPAATAAGGERGRSRGKEDPMAPRRTRDHRYPRTLVRTHRRRGTRIRGHPRQSRVGMPVLELPRADTGLARVGFGVRRQRAYVRRSVRRRGPPAAA
jgi:hypothetical protein